MDVQLLSNNIRRIRKAQGLTQKEVYETAGISPAAYKNLENGRVSPRVQTLQRVALALGVKVQDLLVQIRPLKEVRFRAYKKMRTRDNILADVSRWLDDFNKLEEMLSQTLPYTLRGIPNKVKSLPPEKRCIRAAEDARKILGLSEKEPIHDICGFLESAGIKICPITLKTTDFFGLSISPKDRGPAIVVNTWERISVERMIFSAAHELGHLLLHLDSFNVDVEIEDKKQEEEANVFAAHFLMPTRGFIEEWDEASGLNPVERVFKVKRIFHVSYKTVLFRLLELRKVDTTIWQKFNVAYQKIFENKLSYKKEPFGIGKNEPYTLRKIDFMEDRLSRLVLEAIEKDVISISRGAEILRISIEEIRERIGFWEVRV